MRRLFVLSLSLTTAFASVGCGDDGDCPSGAVCAGGDVGPGTTGAGTTEGGTTGGDTAGSTGGTTGSDEPACEVVHGISCNSNVSGDASSGVKRISAWACAAGKDYAGKSEQTYVLTPDATTHLSIKSVPAGAVDIFVSGEKSGTCDIAGCQGGTDEVSVSVKKGVRQYVTVEGTGGYTLEVTCCNPDCASRNCGDDGCGGSCGTCDAPLLCDEASGACLVQTCSAEAGKLKCDEVKSLVPLGGSGSTDTIVTTQCSEHTYEGHETVYSFFSASDQAVTLELAVSDADQALDILLIKDVGQDGCDPAECVASNDTKVEFAAKAGDQYYVVVDGRKEASSVFTLTTSCCIASCAGKECGNNGCGGSCGECPDNGTCQAGKCELDLGDNNDTCETAATIKGLPYQVEGDTSTAKADYVGNQCADENGDPGNFGDGGTDVVFKYTPSTDIDVIAFLSNADPEGDPGWTDGPRLLYVVEGVCPDVEGATCVGGVDFFFDPGEAVVFPAKAGVPYYVIVDGFSKDEFGPYRLEMLKKP